MTKPMSSSPFFLYPIRAQCNIQSFPTRRSSDLHAQEQRNAAQNVYRSVEHDQKTGLTTFGQFHQHHSQMPRDYGSAGMPRSEERFSRNAETDLVCRLLLEKKKSYKQ